MKIFSTAAVLLGPLCLLGTATCQVQAALLVGNSKGHNILIFDEISGSFLGDFTTPGIGGLRAPDDLTFGPDGNLYVSVGGDGDLNLLDPFYPKDSAVLRFSPTGEFLGVAASGNGLARPYGNAFGPDGSLYVSSFRTNQILKFDGQTGSFLGVFASDNNNGLGALNGLNGPNDLLFGPDGSLYVATQGTANTADGSSVTPYASQVLRYTPEQVAGLIPTTVPELFIDQPALLPENPGFISLLGLALAPDAQSLYLSDYAGSIRRYDLTGNLLDGLSTNYTGTIPSSNFIGSLTFGTGSTRNNLYVTGFDTTQNNLGSLLTFKDGQGSATSFSGSLFTNGVLQRPIGIVATDAIAIPEPSVIAGSLMALAGWGVSRRRKQA
ncbi:PEP-CTERM sorting domain-containing protein [Leptodesmis sichuanensis]|uniref:PEP-CTERM sorting domain-containing protein n=1 Tax=Leptodesmis sichuanensis TaxID=2906798 RepID=UPI001F26BA9C|nr:PEP-CTERM sorting domain-containing protein [Leptodesmis sichuanensis]UIE39345.1 PEP-CTERM sorting domain-containing protein [Leptodesmis sichuanensis A121]